MKASYVLPLNIAVSVVLTGCDGTREEVTERYEDGTRKQVLRLKGEGQSEQVIERMSYNPEGELVRYEDAASGAVKTYLELNGLDERGALQSFLKGTWVSDKQSRTTLSGSIGIDYIQRVWYEFSGNQFLVFGQNFNLDGSPAGERKQITRSDVEYLDGGDFQVHRTYVGDVNKGGRVVEFETPRLTSVDFLGRNSVVFRGQEGGVSSMFSRAQ